jgi:hypothetical protein
MTHQDRVAAALAGFMERHPRGQAPARPRQPLTTPEGRLLRRIVEALRQEPDVLLWRNTVGGGEHDGRRVTYDLALGSSDLIRILRPHGRFVALEVKTPEGRLTELQAQLPERVRRHGGFAQWCGALEERGAAIAGARAGGGA